MKKPGIPGYKKMALQYWGAIFFVQKKRIESTTTGRGERKLSYWFIHSNKDALGSKVSYLGVSVKSKWTSIF